MGLQLLHVDLAHCWLASTRVRASYLSPRTSQFGSSSVSQSSLHSMHFVFTDGSWENKQMCGYWTGWFSPLSIYSQWEHLHLCLTTHIHPLMHWGTKTDTNTVYTHTPWLILLFPLQLRHEKVNLYMLGDLWWPGNSGKVDTWFSWRIQFYCRIQHV